MTTSEERQKLIKKYLREGRSINSMAREFEVNRNIIRQDIAKAPFYLRVFYKYKSRKHRTHL